MLKFIDLFAGIGGFHLALHNLGAKCVFAAEWDKHARKTYKHNFKSISPNLFKSGNFIGDINEIAGKEDTIPDFHILTAGFPCQPFSNAGFKRGFEDTRGTLFFNLVNIMKVKKPEAFFLENVRGLLSHNNGETFATIKRVLKEELGYSFFPKIVKASDYGLPQLRPRLFMVGFKDRSIDFKYPEHRPLKLTMSDIWNAKCNRDIGFTIRCGGRRSGINDRRNWDAYMVDGSIKVLMPEQAKTMQGFPKSFTFPVSDTETMKQLGNSVAIDAIQAVCQEIIKSLEPAYKKLKVKNINVSKLQPAEMSA